MYTELTQLPLLQGMNATDLATIQKEAHIFNTQSGHTFCKQGKICSSLVFIIKGSVTRRTVSPKGDFEFEETVQAPWVIEPESLYGLHCTYSSDYTSTEICTLMTLSKQEIAKLFTKNDIFRMTYLNLLSASLQRNRQDTIRPYTSCAEKRLLHFMESLSSFHFGSKKIKIKMEDLAEYMNETRLRISRILNKWQNLNLIQLQRKEIHIPRFENLISHIISTNTE